MLVHLPQVAAAFTTALLCMLHQLLYFGGTALRPWYTRCTVSERPWCILCQWCSTAQQHCDQRSRHSDADTASTGCSSIKNRLVRPAASSGLPLGMPRLPGIERYAAHSGVTTGQGGTLPAKDGAGIADRSLHKDAVCPCQQLLPVCKGVLDLFLKRCLHWQQSSWQEVRGNVPEHMLPCLMLSASVE